MPQRLSRTGKNVLAGADEIIPVESGHRLFEGYAGPKIFKSSPAPTTTTCRTIPGWWKEVFSFWQQSARQGTDNTDSSAGSMRNRLSPNTDDRQLNLTKFPRYT